MRPLPSYNSLRTVHFFPGRRRVSKAETEGPRSERGTVLPGELKVGTEG